jgi:hypothetical protein
LANRRAKIERANRDGRTIPPSLFCRDCNKPSQRRAIRSQKSRSFVSVEWVAVSRHCLICSAKKSTVPSMTVTKQKTPPKRGPLTASERLFAHACSLKSPLFRKGSLPHQGTAGKPPPFPIKRALIRGCFPRSPPLFPKHTPCVSASDRRRAHCSKSRRRSSAGVMSY